MAKRWLCLVLVGFAAFAWGSKEDDIDDVEAPSAKGRKEICGDILGHLTNHYQRVLVAVSDKRTGDALAILNQHEFSEEQRLLVWRLLVSADPKGANESLTAFRFKEETLQTILEEIVAVSPQYVIQNLRTLAPTQELRVQVAKILSRTMSIAPHMAHFEIVSESDRADIVVANIEAGRWPEIQQYGQHFGITSVEQRTKIMVALLEKNIYTDSSFVNLNDLLRNATPDLRYRIAMALAKSNYYGNAHGWLAGCNDDQRLDIGIAFLVTHINRSGWDVGQMAGFRANYVAGISPSKVFDRIVEILEKVDKKWLKRRAERDTFLFQWSNGSLWSLVTVGNQIKEVLFRRDGAALIAETAHVATLEELNLVEEGDKPDLTRVLTRFAEENPTLLTKEFVNLLWEDVKNRDVSVTLLKEYLSQYDGKMEGAPKTSLELLCAVTGLSLENIKESRLIRNPGLLYEMALDIQDHMARPAFRDIPIAKEVFDKKAEFLELLKLLRDLHEQNGDRTKGWKKTLKMLGISPEVGITLENLNSLRERAKEGLIEAIRAKLANQNIQFTYDQFKQLEDEWGDLEPIWTLLSRFQGSAGWQKEVPLLVEVFEASLNNSFASKKFYGGWRSGAQGANDMNFASAQLYGLTEQEKRVWTTPRVKAQLVGVNRAALDAGAESERAVLTQGKAILSEQLAPVLGGLIREPVPEALGEWVAGDYRKRVLSDIQKSDPMPIVETLLGELAEKEGGGAEVLLRLAWAQALAAPSAVELKGNLKVISALAVFYPELGLKDRQEEWRPTLKRLEQALQSSRGVAAEGEILLSVLSGDPKLLLTVGDAVGVQSCQNYRSGGHIETLLGYVVDANIQALLSFGIKQQQFETAAEFNLVAKAFLEDRVRATSFEGNQKRVTFVITDANGQELPPITSLPLGQAFSRRILRLGSSPQGTPALRAERFYEQRVAQTPAMNQQQEAIIAELGILLRDAHTVQGPVSFEASRNPGGVYSDLGGGIQLGRYRIN